MKNITFSRVKNYIFRNFKILYRKNKYKKMGFKFLEPNYIFLDLFNKDSTIIDVGCGYEAEFSIHVIQKYDSKCVLVDPTKKHAPFLHKIVNKYDKNLSYLQCAISAKDGEINFFEPKNRESGSIMSNHGNMKRDKYLEYPVDSYSLSTILEKIKSDKIALLKLDIEGAEYDLLENISQIELKPFDQIFVEFHHHTVPDYDPLDTRSICEKIKKSGFKYFSLDDHNVLFVRDELV